MLRGKFTIEEIKERHVPAVLFIAKEQLGSAYISENDLLSSKRTTICALSGREVVSFCIAREDRVEKIYEDIPQLRKLELEPLVSAKRVGVIASVATHPKYTGRGIGRMSVEYCIDALKQQGLRVVMMTAWRSPDGVHIAPIANACGFKQIVEIPSFWKEDSLTRGYSCPVCGHPPCNCGAVLYLRE